MMMMMMMISPKMFAASLLQQEPDLDVHAARRAIQPDARHLTANHTLRFEDSQIVSMIE